jgi:hypothetical protein
MRLPDDNFKTIIQVISSKTNKEDWVPSQPGSTNGYYLEAGAAPRTS